jgi:hypothetical protein
LAVAAQALAVAVAVAILHGGVVVPVEGECPGGRPVMAAVKDYGRTTAESEASTPGGADNTEALTRVDVVGRDGIEPSTLRFSAARSTD